MRRTRPRGAPAISFYVSCCIKNQRRLGKIRKDWCNRTTRSALPPLQVILDYETQKLELKNYTSETRLAPHLPLILDDKKRWIALHATCIAL